MIQMVDLKRQYLDIKAEIDDAVRDVLDSAQFVLGPNVARLEGEVADYHGVSHAMGVANGTDALLLALQACGIERGDEVITTPFTFIATAEVIAQLGAVPVFVDIDPNSFNMDVRKIEKKITGKTRALMPVHLFGHPADMDVICELGRKFELKIIEDCAQAFGAEYKGQKVGTFGDCGCFSFFPSKNLACYGDGGMVITSDKGAADRIRMLRNHGSKIKYYHTALGYNSRLDEIQAAIVRVKLNKIDMFNDMRRHNAEQYRTGILRDDIAVPVEMPGCRHVYHQFTLKSEVRDTIAEKLRENDIASAVYYPVPLHRQDVFNRSDNVSDDLKISEDCARTVISLPMFPELTEAEIKQICEVINNVS